MPNGYTVSFILDVPPKLQAGFNDVPDTMRLDTFIEFTVIAREMENFAKSIVHVETGRLRDSIVADVAELPAVELSLSASAPYAGFEEFGTRFRPGHPFMRPTQDMFQPKVTEAVIKAIGQAFNK